MSDIFVIVSCTKRKSVDPRLVEERIGAKPSFDLEREWEYRKMVGDLVIKAISLYQGRLFDVLRRYNNCVSIYILSGRYGLIHGDDYILPYDAYLKEAPSNIFEKWSSYGNWGLKSLKSRKWRFGVICMSHTYLKALLRVINDVERLAEELIVITTKTMPLGRVRVIVTRYQTLHLELNNVLKELCVSRRINL